MQKKLEYLIKILIGITFFVPLIVVPSSYIFPFIVPKIIWFRSLTLLALGLYILLLSSDWTKYRPRLTSINIIVTLFFASFTISTFVGVDWYKSFWDNHERMLGLFTIFHYTIYYFIITSVVKEWKDWKCLLRTFLFAGGLVMFIGFLQRYLNPEMLLNKGATRVSATLGNSIYFSGYGLFLMFIGYLLAVKEVVKKTNPWFWYAVAGGLFGFWGIFGGGTRGTLLGLIAGIGILMISYLFSLKEHKKIRQGLGGLIILGIILIGLLFNFRQTNFVKTIPAIGRLVNTEISSTNTRVMAWGVAIDAWQEKPIFGWGPNNYYYAFNKYYRAEFLEHGWGETWFDNAHSVIFNTLAVQGTTGILVYFGIYLVAIWVLWRNYKKGNLDAHIMSVISAFLIAHLVSLVTVFENPTSYLYFYFFLAFVNSQVINHTQGASVSSDKLEIKDRNSKNISTGLAVVVGLVILLMIYSTNINPARANKNALSAIRNLYQDIDQARELYALASTTPSPHIDDIRMDFARTADSAIKELISVKQVQKANELFDLAYSEIKKNRILHPLDIRVQLLQVQLVFTGMQLKNDPKYLTEAKEAAEDALLKSPRRQQIQYLLAPLRINFGQTDDAIKLLRDSVDDDPKIEEGWLRLLMLYQQLEYIDEAKQIITEAEENGIVWGEQGKQIVNSILQNN